MYEVIVIRKCSGWRQPKEVAHKSRDLDECRAHAMAFRASCSHVWIYTGKELVETIKEPIR